MKLPDGYVWRARVAPMALAAAPPLSLALTATVWLPGAQRLWGVLGAAVVVLVGEVGRDRGRRREQAVWASWGGPPTTQLLRFRNSPNPVATQRRHQQLQRVVGDQLHLPDENEEAQDPGHADQVYETAIGILRQRVRADPSKFELVQAENASYGFRRNLVGLKPYALTAAFLTAAVSFVDLALTHGRHPGSTRALFLPIVLSAVAVLAWSRATDAWVKPVADAYAARLLETVETLAEGSAGTGS